MKTASLFAPRLPGCFPVGAQKLPADSAISLAGSSLFQKIAIRLDPENCKAGSSIIGKSASDKNRCALDDMPFTGLWFYRCGQADDGKPVLPFPCLNPLIFNDHEYRA